MKKENLEKLETILESWHLTPFKHACSLKKRGCDCIGFVLGVFNELKFFPQIKLKDYTFDWWLTEEKHDFFEALKRFLPVKKVDELSDGDILTFSFGRGKEAHCGIFFKGRIYHSLNPAGVVISEVDEKYHNQSWQQRITGIYRVREVEQQGCGCSRATKRLQEKR